MLRITVTNDSVERWSPVIGRHFQMTLAPLQSTIRSVRVALRAPGAHDATRIYRLELQARVANGPELRVSSSHEDGDAAVAHAFARARRELRRARLRTRLVS